MNRFKIIWGLFVNFFRRAATSCQSAYQLSKIVKWGCHINGPGYFTYNHIEFGNGVYIGKDCVLMAAESKIVIKDNVVFGPYIFLIGGDHRFDIVGRTIKSIREKRP